MENNLTETGKYDCYSSLTACINQCPCQENCPKGCEDCENSICECQDLSNSPSYKVCEKQVKENFENCTLDCRETDYNCLSLCNKYFNDQLNKCPCQEECPNGCPCPTYECDSPVEEEKSSVLVLFKHKNIPQNRPLIFDKSGTYSQGLAFYAIKILDILKGIANCSILFTVTIYGSSLKIEPESRHLVHLPFKIKCLFLAVRTSLSIKSVLSTSAVSSDSNHYQFPSNVVDVHYPPTLSIFVSAQTGRRPV